MSSQVVYQTNADYYASEEAIAQNNLIIFEKTKKGLLWFRFTSSRTIFQLSTNGKLQVKWSNLEEKKLLYKLVKSLLIAGKNEELVIKPLKQQTWIDYPEPESFKVYWCDQSTEFVNKKYTEQPTRQNGNAIWGYTQGGKYCIKAATSEEINKKKQLEEIKIELKDIMEKNNKTMEEMRNYRAMNFAELIWEYSTDCYSIGELEHLSHRLEIYEILRENGHLACQETIWTVQHSDAVKLKEEMERDQSQDSTLLACRMSCTIGI